MTAKTEGTIAILAALFVLFGAMLDPRISIVAAVASLVAFGLYRFLRTEK